MVDAMTLENYWNLIDRLAVQMDGEAVLNGSSEHAAIINERMFNYAKSAMRILTRRFDPRIYGTESLIKSATLFAGQNDRKTQVLLEEYEVDELARHPFYEAFWEASNVEFRQMPAVAAEKNHINFTTMDQQSYRFERDKKKAVAVAAFGSDFAKDLNGYFDAIWSFSKPISLRVGA